MGAAGSARRQPMSIALSVILRSGLTASTLKTEYLHTWLLGKEPLVRKNFCHYSMVFFVSLAAGFALSIVLQLLFR